MFEPTTLAEAVKRAKTAEEMMAEDKRALKVHRQEGAPLEGRTGSEERYHASYQLGPRRGSTSQPDWECCRPTGHDSGPPPARQHGQPSRAEPGYWGRGQHRGESYLIKVKSSAVQNHRGLNLGNGDKSLGNRESHLMRESITPVRDNSSGSAFQTFHVP